MESDNGKKIKLELLITINGNLLLNVLITRKIILAAKWWNTFPVWLHLLSACSTEPFLLDTPERPPDVNVRNSNWIITGTMVNFVKLCEIYLFLSPTRATPHILKHSWHLPAITSPLGYHQSGFFWVSSGQKGSREEKRYFFSYKNYKINSVLAEECVCNSRKFQTINHLTAGCKMKVTQVS